MLYLVKGSVGFMGGEFHPEPNQLKTTICFEPPVIMGTVVIGNHHYPVRMGSAKVDTPIYAEAKSITVAEDMTGRTVLLETPNGNNRELLMGLAEDVRRKSEKISDLEKRVAELEKTCLPKDNGLF